MYALIVLVSIAWFPHSLQRNIELGYDWQIYYNFSKYGTEWGWLYADWVKYVFKPFTLLPMEWAFGAWYAVLVSCWLYLVYRVRRTFGQSGFAWVLFAFSFYPMLLVLELGQVTPLLAVLCLTPLGTVLAGIIKPYCFGFLLVHFYIAFFRRPDRGIDKKGELATVCSTDNFINKRKKQ